MTPGIFEICFTGFDSAKKRELVALAEGATNDMFVVRNSVTKTLDILCCGENAGPKKVADAQSKGIHIFDEEQFIKLLETGLITVDGTDARPEPQPLPAL
ncbi:BRCT domain-containing protein [Aeromonas hydrophila]|uniref:BRCT domain-containing protein n=2 Tax=Aeromonadaceae TaxID=84642 RepID=UPI003987BF48